VLNNRQSNLNSLIFNQIILADELTRKNDWEITNLSPIESFYGKTVGLIGYGAIGSAFSIRVKAIGCKVLVYDPFVQKEKLKEGGNEVSDSLEEIWEKSDYISLHVPLNEKTKYIII